MFNQTALTSIDSYKLGHAVQYPQGTTKVYSNFTARSNKYFNGKEQTSNKIVWFGLQAFLQELNTLWETTFFKQSKEQVTKEFQELVVPFCGPNGFDITRLESLHDLGYLPLKIKALPEGSMVNIGVPVLTITNTRSEEYWLPNFLETWMSSELWKASTSATISYAYRKIIDKYAELTGGSKEFVMWQGHDFSVRGMSGITDAAKSGAGHLLSFAGSDNIPALKLVNDCYSGKETFVAGSVPASEHSTATTNILSNDGNKIEGETEFLKRYITEVYPSGVCSYVSDSFDFWQVITEIAPKLKQEILARTPDSLGLAKVVFRPDSGDPVKIICGDSSAEEGTPQYKGSVECLAEIFGTTTNDKGFKTLNPRVGLIYGDSITLERAEEILKQLAAKGYASDNIVFGIGSFTFQYNTRDTFGFAMKATYVEINGEGKAIFKDPKTDDGTKKSATGLLKVTKEGSDFVLKSNATELEETEGKLKTVFLNGHVLNKETFADIRSRLGVM